MKGGFAGNALGNPFGCYRTGVYSGGEILNLLCLLAKNGGELSDVGLNKITAGAVSGRIQPACR